MQIKILYIRTLRQNQLQMIYTFERRVKEHFSATIPEIFRRLITGISVEMKIIASRRVFARSSLLRRGKESAFDIRGCRWDEGHARSPDSFYRNIFASRGRQQPLASSSAREAGRGSAAWRWSDLSLKGRFFQAANPVDCVRKGPPSLEFPVRRGARSSCRRQRRGGRRAKGGERNEERREGESGDSSWGRGAVEPEGWWKSEREIRR